MFGIEVAEGKEIEVFAVVFLLDSFVHVLMGEKLEDQREEVGVEEELCKVLEFHDISGTLGLVHKTKGRTTYERL